MFRVKNKILLAIAIGIASVTGVSAQFNATREAKIQAVLNKLTLEEKVALCAGDNGSFMGIPRLGIPSVGLTDGPRGPHGGPANGGGGSTGFSCGVGQASTWNPELLHKMGVVMGEETHNYGNGVLLGPACNILRDPLGGRFFEYYTEDPYLNSVITAEIVKGIQSQNVAVMLKHYACNNRENNRNNYYSVVDDRTLNEIYLPAFKAAVEKGHAWGFMTSANGVNYEFVSDSRKLQTDILKNKWGFDGVLITDWLQTRSTEKAAFAGLDISMPGGKRCGFGDALLSAVKKGTVSEQTINDKALRILRLYDRIGWLDAKDGKVDVVGNSKRNTPEHIAVAKQVGEEGIVLLKNQGNLLPLDPKKVKNVLVTGPNAEYKNCAWAMGGSSWILSPYETTVLDGVKKAFGDAKVTYVNSNELGGFQPVPTDVLKAGDNGEKGIKARYYVKGKNDPAKTTMVKELNYMWEMRSPDESISVDDWRESRYEATIIPPADGKYTFRFTVGGGNLLVFNGEWGGAPMAVANSANGVATQATGSVDMKKGVPYTLCMIYGKTSGDASLRLEWETPKSDNNTGSWKKLDKLAKKADVVLYVAGLDMNQDTEGRDRLNLTFPTLQEKTINHLAKINKKTIVTLVNGSPLELGGIINNVPALVEAWYPGMEGGSAVADVLTGKANPSGRLTISWPKKLEDVPAQKLGYEDNDVILFTDSLMVGYRYYDTKNVKPQFPFGYGLSYSTFDYSNLTLVKGDGDNVSGRVTVKNTGKRDGKEVVQVYVRPVNPSVFRPAHELKFFKKVEIPAGKSVDVEFELDKDAFSYYDTSIGDWKVDKCSYEIEVCRNSADVVLKQPVSLK